MSAELNERIRALEKDLEDLPKIRDRLSALERFQAIGTTLFLAAGSVLTFCADYIRRKMGL